jgi:hypothetical protein
VEKLIFGSHSGKQDDVARSKSCGRATHRWGITSERDSANLFENAREFRLKVGVAVPDLNCSKVF